mgnify:CR=1 FL=1
MKIQNERVLAALQEMADQIHRAQPNLPDSGAVARIIDQTAVVITAYFQGREEMLRGK